MGKHPRGPLPPHGGRLIDRVVAPDGGDLLEKARGGKTLVLSDRSLSDLEMIAVGAFSPLEGFMTSQDYRRVVEEMHLNSGEPWTIPITLAVSQDEAGRIKEGERVALADGLGQVHGVLDLEEKFSYDKEIEAARVYGTVDLEHPGVAALFQQGQVLLGGKIALLWRHPEPPFKEHRLDPRETRRLFEEKGWKSIVGFQTRNPIHRAHEYIQKCALEVVEGLLIHPLVGETKEDDIPAEIRMRCYKALIDHYYPKDRIVLSVLPAAMRYAGPKEAIFHAIVRKNYGCTHFIVGRDHAGVGNYYGTYDAQRIFDQFSPEELGIVPLCFEHTFYCTRCGNMASPKTCPHGSSDHLTLSGTRVRQLLNAGDSLPSEFTRLEVASVLSEWSRSH